MLQQEEDGDGSPPIRRTPLGGIDVTEAPVRDRPKQQVHDHRHSASKADDRVPRAEGDRPIEPQGFLVRVRRAREPEEPHLVLPRLDGREDPSEQWAQRHRDSEEADIRELRGEVAENLECLEGLLDGVELEDLVPEALRELGVPPEPWHPAVRGHGCGLLSGRAVGRRVHLLRRQPRPRSPHRSRHLVQGLVVRRGRDDADDISHLDSASARRAFGELAAGKADTLRALPTARRVRVHGGHGGHRAPAVARVAEHLSGDGELATAR
mmetsp:Transcript_93150/g.268044  ORF Transcript_93150/g.268044 Transcript_93150/m.268044 type:complete len:267 (-) Transcript_93150:2575-3375(-)